MNWLDRFRESLKTLFGRIFPGRMNWDDSHRFAGVNKEKKIESAGQTDIKEKDLRELANDEDIEVLIAVALNRNTPFDILDRLARKKDMSPEDSQKIADAILQNQNTALKTLLYYHEEGVGLDFIARHPNISDSLMFQYVHSADDHLRFEVLNNPKISQMSVEELVKDKNSKISSHAKKKLDEIYQVGKKKDSLDEQLKAIERIREKRVNESCNRNQDIQKVEVK